MVRVNFLLFGYRRIKLSREDVKTAASLFLQKSIVADNSDDEFFVAERDLLKVKAVLDGRMEHEISDTLGIPGKIKSIKYKRGIAVGVLISIIFMIFSGNLVWDIRIDGNENIPDNEIRAILSDCGLEVGSSWFSINRSRIETEVLSCGDKLSWININRRGTVAYIEVIENTVHRDGEDNEIRSGYANIVAKESCVIEEITVKRGTAMVKPGDAVKAGDILISGVLAQGGFCYAEGSVTGRLSDTVEVAVERNYEKRVESGEEAIGSLLKIWKFDINIFKKYGNSYDSCDIIEDVKVFSLFGGAPLPISYVKKYAISYKTINAEYSDDELVAVASSRLNALTLSELLGSDLLKIRTSGEFTEAGYTMRSEIVYLSEIGKTLEFNVD